MDTAIFHGTPTWCQRWLWPVYVKLSPYVAHGNYRNSYLSCETSQSGGTGDSNRSGSMWTLISHKELCHFDPSVKLLHTSCIHTVLIYKLHWRIAYGMLCPGKLEATRCLKPIREFTVKFAAYIVWICTFIQKCLALIFYVWEDIRVIDCLFDWGLLPVKIISLILSQSIERWG